MTLTLVDSIGADSLAYGRVPLNPFPMVAWVGHQRPAQVLRRRYPAAVISSTTEGPEFEAHLPVDKRLLLAELDVNSADTMTEVGSVFKRVLRYPEWAGASWDALYDLLPDLNWFPDSKIVLWLPRFEVFLTRQPKLAIKLISVVSHLTEDSKNHFPDTNPKRIVIGFDCDSVEEARARLSRYGLQLQRGSRAPRQLKG